MFAATRLLHPSAYACVGHATLRLLTKNASRCSRRGSTYAYNPPRTGRSAFGQIRSCPTAWCSFAGVVTAISGKAGSIRLPLRAA